LLYGVRDQLASHDQQSLLILDNCDDPSTNFGLYVPSGPQVSVVLTTRLSNASRYASPDPQDIGHNLYYRMDGLDKSSATKLILQASGVHSPSGSAIRQAEQIASALEYHPLAIVVASSLVQSTAYSLDEYAEALNDRFTQKELMDTESEQATYRKVSTTFEMSASALQRLAAMDPSAGDALALLEILAFMHHQGISEAVFTRAWEYEDIVLSECNEESLPALSLTSWHVSQSRNYFTRDTTKERVRALLKARAHLIRLNLVKHDATDNTASIHSLVHLWARERIQHATKPWAAAASILALAAGRSGWQPYSHQLAIHCETNFRFGQAAGDIVLHGEALCRIWCRFAWQMVDASHARTIDLVKGLAEEVRGLANSEAENLLTTESQLLRAIVAARYGDVAQAVALLEDVVKIRAKLAEDHPCLLSSKHTLATAYIESRRVPEAIEILEHVIQIQKKVLIQDHHSLLASQHALACAYLDDGRTLAAIEILEHVVQIEEKVLAEDHPTRLASQHALAHAYLEDARASAAIEIFEHVVHRNERLPENDNVRLSSQHGLARAYYHDFRFAEAETLMSHVVAMRQSTLADDNPSRLESERLLAKIRKAERKAH
jgi:tetratricopeptide (TPR) repeat protein